MLTDCGRELHRLLAERSLSLREAARQAGCSPGYLSNVAHGRKPLTPSVAARLDKVLGTSDTFAAFALVQPSTAGLILPDAGVPAGAVSLGISRGNAIAVAAALDEILSGYVQADRLVGSAVLLLPLRGHIATVELACEAARGQDRTSVLAFGSRFMEFCGWAHQDAGDLDCAMQWASKALDYAVELGDQRTIAYTLMRKASIATEAGMPGHGAGISTAALGHGDALTPRLKAVILRQRRHANAALQGPSRQRGTPTPRSPRPSPGPARMRTTARRTAPPCTRRWRPEPSTCAWATPPGRSRFSGQAARSGPTAARPGIARCPWAASPRPTRSWANVTRRELPPKTP